MARKHVRVKAKRTDKPNWTMLIDLIIDGEKRTIIGNQNYFGSSIEDWDGLEEWPFTLKAKKTVFDFGQGALKHPEGPYFPEKTDIFNIAIYVGERFQRKHLDHVSHYEIVQVIEIC